MKSISILLFVALLCFASAAAIDETKIRCKVCDRSIAHIWQQGVELRKHCKLHNTDSRCKHTNLHKHGVEEMVKDVCADVTKQHTAILDGSRFEMTPTESGQDSNNDEALNAAITKSCQKWVLDANSVATLTKYVYANLEAGKPTQAILNPLQAKFCSRACAPAQPEAENDEL
eukprot:GILI01034554.1.p1 GENE.GILI01034554.1~~GILI01034554.1.p1  ORF type:complete len:180 (-),score=13.02 GILI01034554.1:88-606(-)